jgi:ketosteroid isomerase-like protein
LADAASSLARRFFALLEAKDYGGLDAFLHPDVVFAPTMFPGRLYEGREEVLRGFYELVFSLPSYRPEASTFSDLTPDSVLVAGRIHFVDDRGSLHDKSAFWVLTFSDGQLVSLRGKGSRREALRLADELSG